MFTQPLGWFKKPITALGQFKGLKYRTVGLSVDVFTGMGAAVNALPAARSCPQWTAACWMRPNSTT
jgi:TRAP-type mannitol/chloroaromatic compound transport system substrate-binding protein